MRLVPIPNKGGLSADDVTLPRALHATGYVTGMFGKWHLDGPGGSPPKQHFDVTGVTASGWNRNVPEDPKGIVSITSAACKFIEENKQRPFFLYLPHYAVHSPLQARQAAVDKFKKKRPGKLHHNPVYAACIAELDTSIGLVMQKLADLKLEQNTLVLFTSDNGGTAGSQEPLRGKKGCYYEGGIREPMIVRWPAVVKPGTTCDVPVSNIDFYPTFLAAAGAEAPARRPLDGASLLPLFKGETDLAQRALFWHFPGYLDVAVPRGRDPVFRTRPVSVIRKGDWKLLLYHEEWQLDGGRDRIATNNAVELYDLANDPGERKNLALARVEKRDELLAEMLAWMGRVPAPLPTQPNPAYKPAAK
jgi:arylsulfatase A-like enzyme